MLNILSSARRIALWESPLPHEAYGSPVSAHDDQFRSLLSAGSPPKLQWGRVWWLMAFGATVGALLDYLHTHGDEIVYPEGTNHWRGIVTFALVYSCGPIAYIVLFGGEYKFHVPAPYHRSLPATLLWCVMYALTAYGDLPSPITAAILGVVMVYHWRTVDVGTVRSLINAMIGGVICASVEAFLAGVVGTMSYVTQDIFGVPLWLPMLYASSVMSVVQMSRRVLLLDPPSHLWDGPVQPLATKCTEESVGQSTPTLPSTDAPATDWEVKLNRINAALSSGTTCC